MAEKSNDCRHVLAFLNKAKEFWTKKAKRVSTPVSTPVSTRPRSASAPVKELSDAAPSQHRIGPLVLLPPIALGDAFDEAAWNTVDFEQEVRGRPRHRAGNAIGLPQHRWSMPILQQSSHPTAPGPSATPVHLPAEQPTLASEEPTVNIAEEQDFQARAEEIQLLVHRPIEEVDALLSSLKADQELHKAMARQTHLSLGFKVTKPTSPSPPPIPPRNPARLLPPNPTPSSGVDAAEAKDGVSDSGISVTTPDEAEPAGNETEKGTTPEAEMAACK